MIFEAAAATMTLLAALWIALIPGGAAAPKFFGDDPLPRDPETQDASSVQEVEVSDQYDLVESSFKKPGDFTNKRALNVNTVDDVPDSSWFTNRVGRRPMSSAELAKGPDRADPLRW